MHPRDSLSRILVVDDNPNNLRLLTHILGQAGYQARAALNGAVALKSVASHPPDLILLDLRMPEMDGFEVCRQLKSAEHSRDIPVLCLSALHDPEDKLKAFQTGAVDYITKPFSPQEILARVETHLRLARLQGELEQAVRLRTLELEQANRAYRALSTCSRAVLRASEEHELYREVCRIIQRDCDCRLVWIGLAEYDQDKRVIPVAQAGGDDGYLASLEITWAESEHGHGPTGTAVRTGLPVVNRDSESNPDFSPWRDSALARGYRSSAAIPLKAGEAVFGVINLYSDHAGAFAPRELELLIELAENLAYGILMLRIQAEQLEMERRLHESEEKYRILFNNELLAISICDPQSLRFLDVNQAFCRFYGYSREEALNRLRVPELSAEPEKTQATLAKMQNSGENLFVPLRWHRKKDGRAFPVELVGGLYTWHRRQAFFIVALDISERVRAENALRESENRFRALFEQAAIGVAQIDTASGVFLKINQRYCDILGYSQAEMEHLDFQQITHPDDLPLDLANMQRLRDGEIREFRMEKRYYRKDGEVVWVDLNVSPMWQPGEIPDYHIAVVQDIGARKQAEAELAGYRHHLEELVQARTAELEHARQAAEAASAAKSLFLANMSHELRTPLNAILGLAQLLRKDRALGAEQVERLRLIQRSGEQLLALINDILTMSRLGQHSIEVEAIAFDLPALLQDLAGLFQPRAEKRGLLFRLEIPTPLPQRLKGDAGKLRQVLFNLLDNAIKYTPTGRVSLRVETKEAQSGGYRLAFSVRDQGPGIPPARQAVIFDAFVRFGEHQDSLPGTGLGLTISRDYVRLLGGELSLHSAPGQGACFSFTIPLQAAAPLDGAERAPAPAEIPPHAPAALPPPLLLDRLPASLRAQLRQALLDLDAAHLADLREIIWAEDPGLGETLKTYLDNYDYAPLLAALE